MVRTLKQVKMPANLSEVRILEFVNRTRSSQDDYCCSTLELPIYYLLAAFKTVGEPVH